MEKHRLRRWLVAPAALALGLSPILIGQFGTGVAGATITTDTIKYVQSTSSSSYAYVPGNGSASTTQSITPSGTCKTPTTSLAPLLSISALVYKSPVSGVAYTGPASPGTVGTSQGRTGGCDLSPSWGINQSESLVFGPGGNALTSGRIFGEAKIPLQLNTTTSGYVSNGGQSSSSATVKLIERSGSTVVGTQSVVVKGANCTVVTADTGQISAGFTSLELQVTSSSSSSSVSVVQTSTFSLLLLPQAITFHNTPPTNLVVGGTYTVQATGGASGNPVLFSVDSKSTSGCSVNATTGVVTTLPGPAGTCLIDANQAGNATYAAAPQVQQPTAVGLAPQVATITSTPPSQPVTGDTYQVTTSGGGSGNPVVVTVDPSTSTICSIDPATDIVTFLAPGSCLLDANQDGNASYSPAPQYQQPITVYQTICGQQTVSTQSTDGTAQSGEVNASFTFVGYQGEPAPPTVCKSYTEFDASANDGGTQAVTFASQPLATAHVTAVITWAYDGFCTPDGSGNTTICPPTYVSLDGGQTFQLQTYCTSAQAANIEWCTTGRSYTITAQGTQITEDWDGYGDPVFHHT